MPMSWTVRWCANRDTYIPFDVLMVHWLQWDIGVKRQTATVSFVSARISSCCKNTSLAGSIRGSKKLCVLKVLFQQEGSCYKVCPAGENSGICSWTWLAEVERSESWRIKDMFWDTCFLLNKNYHSVTPLPFTKTFLFHILCNIQLISLMCHQTCGCRMDEGTPRFRDLRK